MGHCVSLTAFTGLNELNIRGAAFFNRLGIKDPRRVQSLVGTLPPAAKSARIIGP